MNVTVLEVFSVVGPVGPGLDVLRDALRSIASLHTLPARPQIPIILSGRVRSEGQYEFVPSAPNRPLRITISRRASHPRLTLAHEIGHFMDNQVLHSLKQEFASGYDEDFSLLRSAWEQTRCVKTLRNILSRYAPRMTARDRKDLRQLLSPKERWATTYAQWVATKSQNPALREELNREIQPIGWLGGIRFSSHWDHDDFKPIMTLIEELFRKRGLL